MTQESVTRNTRKESPAMPTTSAGSNNEKLSSVADGEKPLVCSQHHTLHASQLQLLLASPHLSQLYAHPLQLLASPHQPHAILHNQQPLLGESHSLPTASSAMVVVESVI